MAYKATGKGSGHIGGELIVHSPEKAPENELRQWVERKLLWVHQKLLLKKKHSGHTHQLEMVNGESIAYLGYNYRLRIVEGQNEPLSFDGQWFWLCKAAKKDAPKHFQDWYQKEGCRWLAGRVKYWAPKAGKKPSRVSVGNLGVEPQHSIRMLGYRSEGRNGYGGGIAGQNRIGPTRFIQFSKYCLLQFQVFRHHLNGQIRIRPAGKIRRPFNPGKDGFFFFRQLPFLDKFSHRPGNALKALVYHRLAHII